MEKANKFIIPVLTAAVFSVFILLLAADGSNEAGAMPGKWQKENKSRAHDLLVCDVTGRMVSEIINRDMEAGAHEVNINGYHLSSGVYFYKMISPGFAGV